MDGRFFNPNVLRTPQREYRPQPRGPREAGPGEESHTPAHFRNPLAGNSFTGLRCYAPVPGLLVTLEPPNTPFEPRDLHTRQAHRAPYGHAYTPFPLGNTPSPFQRTEILTTKVATFKGFEKNFPHHTPKQLADAGFSCRKNRDIVHCQSCDKDIGNWKPGDIPWIEHARLSPDCALVEREMGQSFIKTITESFDAEKQFKQYCDQHTPVKENPLVTLLDFKESDHYKKLERIYSNLEDFPQRMLKVKRAFVHWHYTENRSGNSTLLPSCILNLINSQDHETAINESCKRFQKEYKEYQAHLKVSEEMQQQIELLKDERIRLFEQVNQQRQTRIKAEQEDEDAKIARGLQDRYNSEQFQSLAPIV